MSGEASALVPAALPPTADRRFNISRWALEHSALTRYLLVVFLVLQKHLLVIIGVVLCEYFLCGLVLQFA